MGRPQKCGLKEEGGEREVEVRVQPNTMIKAPLGMADELSAAISGGEFLAAAAGVSSTDAFEPVQDIKRGSGRREDWASQSRHPAMGRNGFLGVWF